MIHEFSFNGRLDTANFMELSRRVVALNLFGSRGATRLSQVTRILTGAPRNNYVIICSFNFVCKGTAISSRASPESQGSASHGALPFLAHNPFQPCPRICLVPSLARRKAQLTDAPHSVISHSASSGNISYMYIYIFFQLFVLPRYATDKFVMNLLHLVHFL